jgi:hypothetical protein
MNTRRKFKQRNRQQGGYALLLVVFLTALLLVGTLSIGLRVYTEGKREREKEMIWRGKQYVRGIKLCYRKTGRFPTTLDALVKPGTGNIRFMRQAYRDPMNKEDGSWRLIYVGPAGQLIGSLKPRTGGIQMPAPGQPAGTQPAGQQQSGATLGPTPPGAGPGTTGTSATGPGTNPPGTTPTGTDSGSQAVLTGETPTIVGGNIIGVGSKINQSSVIIYEQADNYRLFEFIWDPSKDIGIAGAPGAQIGVPGGQGQNPPGTQPGPGGTIGPTGPMNPPPNPPLTPQNPNPNQ